MMEYGKRVKLWSEGIIKNSVYIGYSVEEDLHAFLSRAIRTREPYVLKIKDLRGGKIVDYGLLNELEQEYAEEILNSKGILK